MSFLCPECATPKSLEIAARIELPPDIRSDEITLQIIECWRCGFAGLAVYQESRRGALDYESYDHVGYYVEIEELKSIRRKILKCPNAGNRRCKCPAHRMFGQCDETGRWNGLVGIQIQRTFGLRI